MAERGGGGGGGGPSDAPRPRASRARRGVAARRAQLADDPLGARDVFREAPEAERERWAGAAHGAAGGTLEEHAGWLAAPADVTVAMEIKLVGFDTDGCVRRAPPRLAPGAPAGAGP